MFPALSLVHLLLCITSSLNCRSTRVKYLLTRDSEALRELRYRLILMGLRNASPKYPEDAKLAMSLEKWHKSACIFVTTT
ncbi:hypothetical protein BDZ97DRAFT_1854171 [Flammula alnicola]|nr:hypothetical protein BDZ97DRAFT_1854171 [Flammula alnicola]